MWSSKVERDDQFSAGVCVEYNVAMSGQRIQLVWLLSGLAFQSEYLSYWNFSSCRGQLFLLACSCVFNFLFGGSHVMNVKKRAFLLSFDVILLEWQMTDLILVQSVAHNKLCHRCFTR